MQVHSPVWALTLTTLQGTLQLYVCVLQMLLKCADIGHLAAEPETHKKWAYMLEEEFFQQVWVVKTLLLQDLLPLCTIQNIEHLPLCPYRT